MSLFHTANLRALKPREDIRPCESRMKNEKWFLFVPSIVVSGHAQDASNPTAHQPEPGAADYCGACAPGAERQFNQNPKAFLVICVRNSKNLAKALAVGMGSGGNALYLAAHG